LKSWLAERSATFRDQVEVVAMDGFGGYKTAATEVLPAATAVMDPFQVVALAGAKLDLCRQRIGSRPAVTAAAPGIPSTACGVPCVPATHR
jgi:transposase